MMKTIKGYIFWTHPRGSVPYDIMVSLILVFLFVGPRFIDFKDKPVPAVPLRSSEVLVKSIVSTGTEPRFTYEVRVEDLGGATSDEDIRAALLRVIEPIAGNVSLLSYTPVRDTKNAVVAYDATVAR